MSSPHQKLIENHIARDDERFECIASDISDIKENHLAHIQTSIAEIARDVWWVRWGVLALIGGIITLFFAK